MKGRENRKIVVLVEGGTERAAGGHLKAFMDRRAGPCPKVRLHLVALDGGLIEGAVRGRAEEHLRNPDTLGVVALTDLYPKFPTPDQAKHTIGRWLPQERCYVHVASHDFEAWLLTDWDAVLRYAGVKYKKPWGPKPEEVDHQLPPAHRLQHLFYNEGKPRRRYKKVH